MPTQPPLGRIALGAHAVLPILTYSSTPWSVCLSVCHIHDLDAICLVDLCGPVTKPTQPPLGRIALGAHAVLPILTYSSTPWSVCLSHSWFRCHLPGRLVRSGDEVCQMGSLPQGEGEIWESNPQSKHATANCYCHLVNTNKELAGPATAIPPFAKLLWSLFHYLFYVIQHI